MKKATEEVQKSMEEKVKEEVERIKAKYFIGKPFGIAQPSFNYIEEETPKGIAAGKPTLKPIKPGTIVSLAGNGYGIADDNSRLITQGFCVVEADEPIKPSQLLTGSEISWSMDFNAVEVQPGGLFSAAMFNSGSHGSLQPQLDESATVMIRQVSKNRIPGLHVGDPARIETRVRFEARTSSANVTGEFKTVDPNDESFKCGQTIPIKDLDPTNPKITALEMNVSSRSHYDYPSFSRGLTRELFGSNRLPVWSAAEFAKLSLATKKLDTILQDTHGLKKKLKKQGKQWATMQEVAPKWHKKITDYFSKHVGSRTVTALENSGKCIMGETFKGSNWGDNNKGKPCTECKYLGTEALKLFSDFGEHDRIKLTDSEGWNNYQARFEYHWNNSHV